MAAGHQSVRVSVCGITSPLPLATYLQAYSLYRPGSPWPVTATPQLVTAVVKRTSPTLLSRATLRPYVYVRFNTRIDQDCVHTLAYCVHLTAATTDLTLGSFAARFRSLQATGTPLFVIFYPIWSSSHGGTFRTLLSRRVKFRVCGFKFRVCYL